MWKRVEAVVDDIRPLIQSVGIDAKVVDVLDQVVTIELLRVDASARPDLQRLRDFVAKEVQHEIPEIQGVEFEGDLAASAPAATPAGSRVTYATPDAEADTVVLTLDRAAAPTATTVFDTADAAAEWPLAAAALAVPGVVSVVGRDTRLIVARDADAAWDTVLPALEAALSGPAVPGDSGGLRAAVEALIEERINPALASHGGWIKVTDVQGSELTLLMGGGCQGCAQSQATLRQGVAQTIRDALPQVTAIHDATDQEAGENPYFT